MLKSLNKNEFIETTLLSISLSSWQGGRLILARAIQRGERMVLSKERPDVQQRSVDVKRADEPPLIAMER